MREAAVISAAMTCVTTIAKHGSSTRGNTLRQTGHHCDLPGF